MMPSYPFICEQCGSVEITCSMKDVSEVMNCTKCGGFVKREYKPVADVWKTDGAYSKSNHKE